MASVREVGLLPLNVDHRRSRLTRVLSRHPTWPHISHRFDEMLHAYGVGMRGGMREGQAHLTLSRAGLTNSFNHYLQYGAEVDQRIAHALLGEEGTRLLAEDGTPMLLKFAVPGEIALKAAHPFFSIEDMRARGDLPNICKQFLSAWSYSLFDQSVQACDLHVDCGLIFYSSVPASWLISVDTVPLGASAVSLEKMGR